jgi:hypothetical protein
VNRFVNVLALGAALTSLICDIWRDYGALAAGKRAALAYFAFFIVGSLLSLMFKTGIQDEWVREDWQRRRIAKARQEQARAAEELRRLEEKKRREAEKAAKKGKPAAAG